MPDADGHGWVRVADSAPPPGSLCAVGGDAVAWTTESGVTCVVDGRCPHQWSPLAVDGVVAGEELYCTAHGWRFDVFGSGTKVNALGRRDPKADIDVIPHRVSEDGSLWTR